MRQSGISKSHIAIALLTLFFVALLSVLPAYPTNAVSNSVSTQAISAGCAALPVQTNLFACYQADDYVSATKSWPDSSGNNRHVTNLLFTDTAPTLETTTVNTNGVTLSFKTLRGSTLQGLKFPSEVLPETYTLFHIARYNGTEGRIFDGVTRNWLSGFWTSNAGVAFHNGWLTPVVDSHTTNWVLSSDQRGLYRSNGQQRSSSIGGNVADELSINYGLAEKSAWEVAEVIVFDRALTLTEIYNTEVFLKDKYGFSEYLANKIAPATIALQPDSDRGNSAVDLVTSGTLLFDVTYPVAATTNPAGQGLVVGDFSNSGTATCTFASLTRVTASSFTVAATCTTPGTLIPHIPADAATNTIGDPSDASTSTQTISVDTSRPTILSMCPTTGVGCSANNTYYLDDEVLITAKLSEPANVDTSAGSPTISLAISPNSRSASFVSGSGTDTLIFKYKVQAGDYAGRLSTQGTNISLNGSTIKDASGNDLVLVLPSAPNRLGDNTNIVIERNSRPISSAPAPEPTPAPAPAPKQNSPVAIVVPEPIVAPAVTPVTQTPATEPEAVAIEDSVLAALTSPEGAAGTAITALAILGAGAGSSKGKGKDEATENNETEEAKGEVAVVDFSTRGLLLAKQATGDVLPIWKLKALTWFDKPSYNATLRIAPISPLLSKLINDGAYIRAMIGSLALVISTISGFVGVTSALANDAKVLPPATASLLIIAVIGVIDTLAGFIGISLFMLTTFITCDFDSVADYRLLLGVFIVGFAPALITTKFREIRRVPENSAAYIWERITDFVVAPFFGGWVTAAMIGTLPALAGLELSIAADATKFGWTIAIMLSLRVALEEVAGRLFPKRLNLLHPDSIPESSNTQKVLVLFVRAAIFWFVAYAFVGGSWQLNVGAVLFTLPNLIGIFSDKVPFAGSVKGYLPSGLPGLIFGLILSTLVVLALTNLLPNTDNLAKWALIVLPIFGTFMALLGIALRDGDSQRWHQKQGRHWIYRVGGVFMLLVALRVTGLV